MKPAARAALAERLRASCDEGVCPTVRDRIAAATDLEHPRAIVEFTAPTGDTVEAHLRGVGTIWSGSVTSAPAHAERWRAAGLDVGEVSRGEQ